MAIAARHKGCADGGAYARLTAVPACPTCGADLDAAARFCPKDGTTVKPDPPSVKADDALFPRGEVVRATQPMKPASGAAEKDVLVGATIDGRYRVKARLGHGGVGAVYEGEHVETGRPVAVKVLHAVFAGTEEFHKRFEREARAASRLTHPSCVSVIDFGRVDRVEPLASGEKLLGIPYLVMEYVRGKSLAERIETAPERRLPPTEAVVIARGVASALRHAHGLGIVHRDIKPANIMLVEDGGTGLLVKLLDFGLAKMVGESDNDGSEPLTQAGMVFGTPGYLSPEQASGKPADARSDLYALGVVLYELVAGRRPFLRKDPLDVVRDHLQTLPPPPRSFGAQISSELEACILRALAKDPKGRWQSAEELSHALAATPEVRGAPAATAPAAPSMASTSAAASASAPSAAPSMAAPSASSMVAAPGAAPSTRARPRWLADRRHLGLAAVAVLALLLTVALVVAATRHPPAPTAVAPAPAPVRAPPPPIGEAARRHLSQASGYAASLWCSDALNELERALHDDERLRDDRTVQSIAIRCLTPKTRDKATRFLVERVGAAARDALEAAVASDANAEVRHAAQKALERLPR